MSNQVIIHKKSAIADKKPTTEQLQYGELAINTHDGRLYTKVDDGVERVINLASKPAVASNTPPANPEDGSLWFDLNDASLNIYYDDGDSKQWISITETEIDLSDSSIGDLIDVDILTNTPANGQTIVWNGTKFVPGDVGTDLSESTTDDLAEGTTNRYYTDARVQSVIDTNTAGFITDYTVTEADVTAHQSALTITESQISDLGTYATETYVDTAVSNLVDAAPETLDTLNELAAALGDDANFATTVTDSIALKANSADLSTVATSGDYGDLLNTPTIPAALTDLSITDGTNGQLLSTDGAGSFTFIDAPDTGVSVSFGTTAPSSPSAGDFWYNESIAEMFVYDGTNWITTADGVGDFFSEQTTDALIEGASNKYFTDARAQAVIDTNTAGFITDYTVTEADVTTHQAALSITESQISDLGSYIELGDLSVTNATASGGGALSYNIANGTFTFTPPDLSSYITDYTVTEADVTTHQAALSITESQISDLQSYLTDYTVTEADVTTHQAALSITESQISDLQSYLTSETNTSLAINANVLTYTDETGTSTDIDLSLYLDDSNLARLVSGTVDASTGIATFTRDDATTFTVDYSAFLDDTNLTRIDSATFNTADGVLTLTRGGDSTTVTVDLDGRFALSSDLPTAVSELTNDSGYLTTVAFSDLTTVPTTLAGYGITDAATSAQGTLADSAVQPSDNISVLTNDSGFITDYTVTESDVTTHQAALSITESQISDLQSYLTDYTVTEADVTAHQAALSITQSQISDLTIPETLTDLSITDGTTGQLLSTDGAGNFTFIDAPETGSSVTSSDTAPSSPSTGDLWYDTTDATLNIYYTDADSSQWVVVGDNEGLTSLSGLTSDDLSEGSTNLYYTDAKVQTVIDTNTAGFITAADIADFATETYVDTAVANLVDTAPTALDTLNELAAALGDDPNFATTVTNSIGLKANTADLATVATSGDYGDLINTPTIPADVSDLTDTTNLLFDGDYDSLTNTPTIPAALTDLSITDGTNGQLLSTDGSGSFTFIDAPDTGVSVEFGTTAPSSPSSGDFWYNESLAELFVYDGTNWITTADGVGDFFSEQTTDSLIEGASNKYYTDDKVQTVIDTNTAGFITDYTVTETDVTTHQAALSITESQISDLQSYLTDYTVTEADVTTHQAALSITESQISDLGTYLTSSDLTGYATETYVDTAVSNLVDAAPATLDTLNELAAALGDDPNFATTVSNSIGLKANSADLATVATSGDYGDLLNTPTIPTNLSELTIDSDTDFGTNKILYSNVYSNLVDLPSAASYHGMFAHVHGTGKAYYAHAGSWVELANTSEVFDGDYNSLTNTPTLFDGDYNSLTNTPTLFDGDYSSLTNTPTIPSSLTDLSITDGTTGQVLSTDGAGNFTFIDAATGEAGASVTVSDTAPSSPSDGDLWYDLNDASLNIYYSDGTSSQWVATGDGDTIVDLSAIDQSIIPDTDVAYDLGSPTKQWRDIYVGPGSLYVNGTKVLEDNNGTINVTADENQSIRVGTTGTGQTTIDSAAGVNVTATGSADITLTTATGQIELNGDVVIDVTKAITSSTGEAITFNAPISVGTNTITAQNFVGNLSGTIDDISNFTSDDLSEGSTNLYYTDAKVQTVIDNNTAGFATETYVDTAVSNLVDTAPETLDTLNELAAALGDDPNFATSVSNSIGLKANSADLATVATSGDYTDLINTPTIPTNLSELTIDSDTDFGTNKILYSNVYSTLGDLPSAASYHGMFAHVHGTGKAYYAHAGAWVELANASEVFDGDYNSLSNTPTLFDGDYSSLTNTPTLFDGDYNSLTNTPTIPSAITDLGISDGTSGQVLSTDGAGNFTFIDAATGGGGASVTVSDTAPSSPSEGDLWLDSTVVKLFIYYDGFWVESTGSAGGGSAGGGASVEVSDTAPSSPSEGDLWYNTTTLDFYIYYSSNWVEAAGGGSGSSNTWTEQSTNYTASAGDKLFVDTSSNSVTVTLPASPSMGDEIRIIDATGSASTNNIVINRSGNNIEAVATDLTIDVDRAAFSLVYYNATQGWLFTEK